MKHIRIWKNSTQNVLKQISYTTLWGLVKDDGYTCACSKYMWATLFKDFHEEKYGQLELNKRLIKDEDQNLTFIRMVLCCTIGLEVLIKSTSSCWWKYFTRHILYLLMEPSRFCLRWYIHLQPTTFMLHWNGIRDHVPTHWRAVNSISIAIRHLGTLDTCV